MNVDFHIHTEFSIDGNTDVFSVLDMAKKAKLNAFAITDHDSIKANSIAKKLLKKKKCFKPHLVCGIEMSTVENGMWIHMLGLDIDEKSKKLKKFLKEFKIKNLNRIKLIAGEVVKMGFKLNEKLLKNLYKNKMIVGKPQLAEVMVASGAVQNNKEAMKIIDPIHFNFLQTSPKQAIEIIRQARGLSVLAHPVEILDQLNKNKKEFEKLLKTYCEAGLNGIEVFCPRHSSEDEKYFESLAKKFKLFISGGSDFHGKARRANEEIGKFTSYQNKINITKEILKNATKRNT